MPVKKCMSCGSKSYDCIRSRGNADLPSGLYCYGCLDKNNLIPDSIVLRQEFVERENSYRAHHRKNFDGRYEGGGV